MSQGDDRNPAAAERARGAVLEHARELAGATPVTLGHALAAAAQVRQALDEQLRALVADARGEGATWADIGAALGVSAQAAQQRYGRDGSTGR